MASLPIFMTAVANSSDEPAFPLLFTWSTHEAQVKEVLVIPDDEWLENHRIEPNAHDLDEQQLYEFGFEASDILAEWINEFDTDVIYALEPESLNLLVEATYDIKGLEPSFEVQSIHSWFEERDVDLDDAVVAQGQLTPLHLLPPDELVIQLLQIAVEHGLIDPSDIPVTED
ncbi:hypothetical protein EBI01_04690 [Marinomonas rhizomae]|uniref:Uncharacterized protein n=1 Tax=Marinomonas rhizomae TaxID=491948 RepID=A0A366JC87_9GAMM|nr:hypothetical protein [Marinomonas rhizomae]RBP84562.1 hypothetical protein DFP80_10332 [Marinomonas rhizomae]RNF75233.1 hypothetical protein EBI01_04690 [Marinomonas rhizomae]